MRPSNNKVDMEELVFLSSTHRGHAMSSNPNSNRECFPVRKTQFSSTLDFGDPSPIDIQTFESKKYRRTAKRKVNSSGEPFFLKGTRFSRQGNKNPHFNQHRAGFSFVCNSYLPLLVIETPVFWLEF